MKTTHYFEVPVTIEVQRVRRMNPFHWALLRAIQVFANTRRPGFEEMAGRLCIGEAAFLEDAWRDLCEFHAVDAREFSEAGLTMEGEVALQNGFFPLGMGSERKHNLYFSRTGEAVFPDTDGTPGASPAFADLPKWSGQLTCERIERLLRKQDGAATLGSDDRVVRVQAAWNAAREMEGPARPLEQHKARA